MPTQPGIEELLSTIVSQATTFVPNGLAAWAGRVQEFYVKRWRPFQEARVQCRVTEPSSVPKGPPVTCSQPAASPCYFCGSAVCLHHAAVTDIGILTCLPCLKKIPRTAPQQGQAPPASPPQDYRTVCDGHLRTLGLCEPSSLEEIQKSYRELAAKHHPDKGGDAQKMAAVNVAYHWLKEHYR